MTEATRPRLPTHLLIALALIGVLLLASCFSRQLSGLGWDFEAYFKAAGRWLSGTTPYFYEKNFSYKYSPVMVLPFTFFHLFSYESARWIYAALHAMVALSLPCLLYSILEKDTRLHLRRKPETFATGLLVAFLGSFRFIDGEFHVSQIGLWIIWTLLAGVVVLQKIGHRKWGRALGLALMSLASLVKIHSSIFFLSFLKWRSKKTWAWVGGVFVLIAMLPDPRMWLDWAEQIRRTTYDLPINETSINLQGFYPFGVVQLGLNQFSPEPLLLAVPFFIACFFFTSRYSLRDIRLSPLPVLLSISSWLLLGFMASPLPWQYTYSILWVLIPLSWVSSSSSERRALLVIALFLGLSPQGIVGKATSMWIESHHSVFFAILFFWILLLRQAHRWRLRD
jgi:hypothetical protein